jgi:AraC-like DNA-binding protein
MLLLLQMLESQAFGEEAEARFRAILQRERVEESAFADPQTQAPLHWFREVYPELDTARATVLGFDLAAEAHLTSFGPLSIPLVSAGSVAEIVDLLAYLPLISTALTPEFHSDDHGLTVGLAGHTGDVDLDCLIITYAGVALLRLIEMLAGDVPSVTLHLSWTAPDLLTDRSIEATCSVEFGAPAPYLQIPTNTLNEVCRFSDPLAYRLAIADLQRTLEVRTESTLLSERVRQLMRDAAGQADRSWIADQLSMSTSTLKRRLADESTTFRELRQLSLRDRATLRLMDQSLSVQQVAMDLGYSDLSSFSHAFKRWTGRTPSEFRSGFAYRPLEPADSSPR